MFGYFRLFSLISLIVVIGLTGGAGIMLRNAAIENIKQLIDSNNESIANAYIESVWKTHQEAVAIFKNGISDEDKTNTDSMKLVQDFGKDTVSYFRKMPLLRVNVYNASGALLITNNVSSGNALTISGTSPDAEFVKNNFASVSAISQVLPSIKLRSHDDGVVLQTILPVVITDANGEMQGDRQGMIELVADLTTPLQEMIHAHILGIIYIVGFFVLYLGVIFFVAKRTENIITKQHEANVELVAKAAAAQSESRDKTLFLANISHELRTPLNSIIGFSEILKDNPVKEMEKEKVDGYIGDIYSSGVHLLSLINDILDYSKAEAGKLELDLAEANLNKLVHNCVRLVTPRAQDAQVNLVEALPKEILNIVTDSKKFKQILLNLLSNAIKFTPAGGEVRITAWANVADDSIMFEVKDSGIGIAPKDISKAMSAFGQVDNTLSKKYDGTGLGLPLTKKFVELMGGKFEIESEVNVGTTIRFSVPRIVQSTNNAGNSEEVQASEQS